MIDIHCHLLPAIDDGAKTLEESLKIFRNAANAGLSDIILTPHYIKGTEYCFNNKSKDQLIEVMREALRREKIKIKIYSGNEVYIDRELPELVKKGEVATLAGSRYLLLELPINSEDNSAGEVVFNLKSMGITPIIAHPERYEYFKARPDRVKRYLELGCLLQGDYHSLLGKYGRRSQKALKVFLKRGQISFLGSDTHRYTQDYRLAEAERAVLKIVKDREKVEELFLENPKKVIKNQIIKLGEKNGK
ncbi:MAG: hypothetical protein Q4E70_02605 [Candidatus Saccharibacteria bacterium]|nr:hypothetical protein [Candidatus Saccharibacteria bacterium]